MRSSFDGAETILSGGQGVLNQGRRGRKRTGVPDWVEDETRVRAILLKAFPKLVTDAGQRARAGRWARVIDGYYREGAPAQDIADDLGISKQSVELILTRLRFHASGNTRRSRPAGRPRGRPKKQGYANRGLV